MGAIQTLTCEVKSQAADIMQIRQQSEQQASALSKMRNLQNEATDQMMKKSVRRLLKKGAVKMGEIFCDNEFSTLM